MNIFAVLAVIDFESDNIDHDEMCRRLRKVGIINEWEFRKNVYFSKIFQLWYFIYRISPNFSTLDRMLNACCREHIDIGNLTIFGYNAMMWSWQWRGKRNYWLFRPPCFLIMGKRGFNWGRLYYSPDGTSQHPKSIHFYGSGVI